MKVIKMPVIKQRIIEFANVPLSKKTCFIFQKIHVKYLKGLQIESSEIFGTYILGNKMLSYDNSKRNYFFINKNIQLSANFLNALFFYIILKIKLCQNNIKCK